MEDAAGAEGEGLPGGDSPRVALPPGVAEELCRKAWDAVDRIGKSELRARATDVPPDLKGEIESLIESGGFSEEQRKTLGEITPLAAQELGIDLTTSPCVAVGIIAAFGVASFVHTARTISQIAADYRHRQTGASTN